MVRLAPLLAVLLTGSAHAAPAAPAAPPAAPAYLSRLEAQVLAELDQVRAAPRSYAAVLVELRQHYRGRLLELPGQVPLMTVEGAAAVDEAVRALRASPTLPRLRPSPGMSRAARGHAEDIGPRGLTSHLGSHGSDPFRRLGCCGTWEGSAGENIQYGGRDAREVVVQLLVDDGVPGRGHRKNILSPSFRVVGIGCGRHARFRSVCVIDFAAGYRER
jgi:uncharacterized protein YkwD